MERNELIEEAKRLRDNAQDDTLEKIVSGEVVNLLEDDEKEFGKKKCYLCIIKKAIVDRYKFLRDWAVDYYKFTVFRLYCFLYHAIHQFGMKFYTKIESKFRTNLVKPNKRYSYLAIYNKVDRYYDFAAERAVINLIAISQEEKDDILCKENGISGSFDSESYEDGLKRVDMKRDYILQRLNEDAEQFLNPKNNLYGQGIIAEHAPIKVDGIEIPSLKVKYLDKTQLPPEDFGKVKLLKVKDETLPVPIVFQEPEKDKETL